MSGVRVPFGSPAIREVSGASGATSETINGEDHIVSLTSMDGAVTLNLTLDDELPIGHVLIIRAVQDGTGRNVTTGTGFASNTADLTGVANDTDQLVCVFDGTQYCSIGGWTKIVDAA